MNRLSVTYFPVRQSAGLVLEPKNWGFLADRSSALLADYSKEQAATQLAAARTKSGPARRTVKANSSRFYETCDCCKSRQLPFDLHFDGEKFLCRDCRTENR
jgi:hypothetical protein